MVECVCAEWCFGRDKECAKATAAEEQATALRGQLSHSQAVAGELERVAATSKHDDKHTISSLEEEIEELEDKLKEAANQKAQVASHLKLRM